MALSFLPVGAVNARIRINSLEIIDATESVASVLNMARVVAYQMMGEDYKDFKFCINTYKQEVCCTVAPGFEHPRCTIYLMR